MEFNSIDHVQFLLEFAEIKLAIYEIAAQLKEDQIYTKEKAIADLLVIGEQIQQSETFHLKQFKSAIDE